MFCKGVIVLKKFGGEGMISDNFKTNETDWTIEDILISPDTWQFNCDEATMIGLKNPISELYSTEPYIFGPPRDSKTKEISYELVEQDMVGAYLP